LNFSAGFLMSFVFLNGIHGVFLEAMVEY